MAERAGGDRSGQEQRLAFTEQQEQYCLLEQHDPITREDIRIQDCTKDARTAMVMISSSGRNKFCYLHDRYERANTFSCPSSIDCSINSSSSSSSTSSASSNTGSGSTTQANMAAPCHSHLPGVDFSAFVFSGSESGGGRSNCGSRIYPKTEPPSSDTSGSYGFPKEDITTRFASDGTFEASEGTSPPSPADGGFIVPELDDDRFEHLHGSPSTESVPVGYVKTRRTAAGAEKSSIGYCCGRDFLSRSACKSGDSTMSRVVAGQNGDIFAASPSANLPSASWGGDREKLDGGGVNGSCISGGADIPTGGNRPPHRLWSSLPSQRGASPAPASTAHDTAAATFSIALTTFDRMCDQELFRGCSSVIATGDDDGYRSAADYVLNREDGRNHKDDIRRFGDVEALGREARNPDTMRIPRHRGFESSIDYPEVSTAKRARCTRVPRECTNEELRDGSERGGRGGVAKQTDSGNDSGNVKPMANISEPHRNSDKYDATSTFDGMDDVSFSVLQAPTIATARNECWKSSASLCVGGSGRGASAGGILASRGGFPGDMNDMMESFEDITLSKNSESTSGSSQGRVLLRTRAMRAIKSFPSVVTCFRGDAAAHNEDGDSEWRGGRSLSDSVVPMDQVCSVGLCQNEKEGRGVGGLRGAGRRLISRHNQCIQHDSKRGVERGGRNPSGGADFDDGHGSGGDALDDVVVGVKAAAWPGASHEGGKLVTVGEDSERWIRSNSSSSSSSTCSVCSNSTRADVVEVWKEKGGRRAPRPVTQAARSENARRSRKHRLN